MQATQFQRRAADERQLRFLSAHIEDSNLRDLELAAELQIDQSQLIPVAARGAGVAYQPRVLLGLKLKLPPCVDRASNSQAPTAQQIPRRTKPSATANWPLWRWRRRS